MSDIIFDWISADDLDSAIKIEQEGFPADEAATLDTFRFRQSQAGDLFLGAYTQPQHELIGYVCSTRANGEIVTHESMSAHVPGGPSVCIHSVCVSTKYRRQGIALRLLREYLSRLKSASESAGAGYERVLLIAHEELVPLYQKAGFELVGKSSVTHGARPWFEMRFDLRSDPLGTGVQVPVGVWEALQASSVSRGGPAPKTLSGYERGVDDLVIESGPSRTNKTRILCPRCSSIILLENVASLVEGPSIQIDPPNTTSIHPLLPALPSPPETTHWWLVTPSPMKFENIGFSRPVEGMNTSARGKKLKLLACAECDLGPVGWSEEGGTEFWLAVSRVGYK